MYLSHYGQWIKITESVRRFWGVKIVDETDHPNDSLHENLWSYRMEMGGIMGRD